MKLTNKFKLPSPVVRALSFDDYSKGSADYSVTELIDSPRVRALRWLNADKIERDVTDNFFSLLGRACHQILQWGGEKTDGATAEERLFLSIEIDGVPYTISGSMDLQEAVIMKPPSDWDGVVDISDYKVTSVVSASSDKIAWEQQLNIYAHLVRNVKKKLVRDLKIIVFLRDWRKGMIERDPNYPRSPIMVLPVKRWGEAEAAQYVQERLRLHIEAGEAVLSGEEPVACSTEERWEGAATFAAIKPGGKRAVKLFDSEAEASSFARENSLDLERRGGEPRRCLGNWCGVAEFCEYGKRVRSNQTG